MTVFVTLVRLLSGYDIRRRLILVFRGMTMWALSRLDLRLGVNLSEVSAEVGGVWCKVIP